MDAIPISIEDDAELAHALVDRPWNSTEPAELARLEAQARLIAAACMCLPNCSCRPCAGVRADV